MQLKTSQLKDFIRRTSAVKSYGILPILDHLHIQPGRITKSNMNTFVSAPIDADSELLIDQRVLSAILNQTSAKELTVTYTDKTVTLTDGKTKVTHAFTPSDHFPLMPALPNTNPFTLTQSMMDAIVISSSFVSVIAEDKAFRSVNMHGNFIAATDRHKLYYESFAGNLPSVLIQTENIPLIAPLIDPELYVSESRWFVVAPEATYCFSQVDDKIPDFASLATRFSAAQQAFELSKTDLLDFCTLCNAVSPLQATIFTISSTGLSLIDPDRSASCDLRLPDVKLRLNARVVASPLKTIPISSLQCSVAHGALTIKENSMLVAFMGVVEQ